MNILFLSELFYPHGGGAEFATYLYAKLLSESGFKVVVVTNRFEGESEASNRGNLTILRLPLFKGGQRGKYSVLSRLDVQFSSFLRKQLKWASVVYVPRLWYSMIPYMKAHKKPVVVHLHDYSPICPLSILYDSSNHRVCRDKRVCSPRCIYQFEKDQRRDAKDAILSLSLNLFAKHPLGKCVEQADAIVCVSKAQRRILVERMPMICNKTRVIYNPMPRIPAVEINGDDFGYLGGLNPLKGREVLDNSLSLIGDHSFKVHFTGSSITREIVNNEGYTKYFKRIGVVLHEKLERSDQEAFYRQIKGVIFPSIVEEPLPYVTAEAILRGRLLIASKIGGIPEQVKGCKGVYLFEPGNHRELAEILSYVKGLDKNAVFEMSYHNREVFFRTFDNEKTISDFGRILNSLI